MTGLEVLRNTAAGPELQARARERMTRQLRQMVRLIDDLLDVSRITTNKLELHRQVLDLVVLVREAVEVADPLLRDRRHAVETHWPPGPIWVDGDATRLTQVVVNLLNNAAKYTPSGGRISVAVDFEDGRARVRVADNGLGIDPTQQADIFEMFMQVDRSLERERAGLGVGLSLARRLVELHGGSITVASDGLGRGSTFSVALPTVAAPSASAGAARAGTSGEGAPLRILIADDSVDLATSLGDMLQSLGHDVRIVHDGRAAYEAAVAEVPDVALFDIGMPLLNGYELARRVRANPATRDLMMVAITGWGQDADRQRARDAGFDRHLVKPVEPGDLIELLRTCRPRTAGGAPLMRA